MSQSVKSVIDEFHSSVNMTAKELKSWLETEESLLVGQKKDDDESIGHKSGKHIVELLHKKKNDYTDDDISHMKKVISYIHRHLAQQPDGDIEHTPWRYSSHELGT